MASHSKREHSSQTGSKSFMENSREGVQKQELVQDTAEAGKGIPEDLRQEKGSAQQDRIRTEITM